MTTAADHLRLLIECLTSYEHSTYTNMVILICQKLIGTPLPARMTRSTDHSFYLQQSLVIASLLIFLPTTIMYWISFCPPMLTSLVMLVLIFLLNQRSCSYTF